MEMSWCMYGVKRQLSGIVFFPYHVDPGNGTQDRLGGKHPSTGPSYWLQFFFLNNLVNQKMMVIDGGDCF